MCFIMTMKQKPRLFSCLVFSVFLPCCASCSESDLTGDASSDVFGPEDVFHDQVNPEYKVLSIAAGGVHTCALLDTGGARCWGSNSMGQLGNGTTEDSGTPKDVTGLSSGVSVLSTKGNHTCALLYTGGVKCWGNNEFGELGDGTRGNSRSIPVDVVGMSSGVSSIAAAGYAHTCVLLDTGGVQCWGSDEYGQLGDGGSGEDSTTPVDAAGMSSGAFALFSGARHTCAVMDTYHARCWGHNNKGQLGDGTEERIRTAPADVTVLSSSVFMIAAGCNHTCALINAGGVQCWGQNQQGQLGDGTAESSRNAVDVAGLRSGVSAVFAGCSHTCALLDTGGVKCWGWNQDGQLGDGTAGEGLMRTTPVDVVGLSSGVSALAVGWRHTCALLVTGRVKCWGENVYGQLGDGTMESSTIPVNVAP